MCTLNRIPRLLVISGLAIVAFMEAGCTETLHVRTGDPVAGVYPNGRLMYYGYKSEGYRHGIWTLYFPSGLPSEIVDFSKGSREGVCWMFFPSGTLKARGQYRADRAYGTWVFYFPDGTRALEGELEGPTSARAREDDASRIGDEPSQVFGGPMDVGFTRQGVWREWHRNGHLSATGKYVDGLRQGRWREWSVDGLREFETEYRDGIRTK